MTVRPWLSIVTVVKDDAPGLNATLRSLQSVDLTDMEHLVIDSSADPGSVESLVATHGLGSRLVWTRPAGVYAAMNVGLGEASGETVLFLNAGDELASADVLTLAREAMVASGAEWLHGPVEIIGADGTSVETPAWDYEEEKSWAFARGRFPAHQGTIARTESLRSIGGFDPSYSVAADYAVFLKLTQQGPPAVIDARMARFHEGGLSTVRWTRSLRDFHRARMEILVPTGHLARRERWASARQFATLATHRSPWPLVALLVALGVLIMGATGVAWSTSLLLAACATAQGVGGALWWRLMRPGRSVPILEAVGMGLGLGTAASMLVGLFLTWWLAPLAAGAAWVLLRRRVSALAPLQRPDLAALLVGLAPGLGALGLALRSYPLTWVGTWSGYHGDMPFFEALAASVARLGPGASIFMEGADLRYHSLAYGWAGQLTLFVDAAPFVVLTRLLPYVGLVAAIAITSAWTRQLTRVWWAPALAVGLVVTGGFVGATYGSVLNMDSPSQTMGAVWILALSVVLMQTLGRVSLGWSLAAVAVLVVALTGGKISTAAVAAAGFGVVILVGLLRRERWWPRALAAGVVAGVALVGTYLWLLAGSANAGGLGLFSLLDRASSVQGLNPVVTPRGVVAGILLLMIAVLPRWAGLAWLAGDRGTRWAPSTLYGIGLSAGGLATIAVLSGGFNDLWFAAAASAPLAVLSAVGTARAVAWLGREARGRVIAAAGWGLLASIAVAAMWASGSTGIIGQGWRWAGPLTGFALAILGSVVLAQRINRPRLQALVALGVVILVTMALPARLIYAAAEPFARPQEGALPALLFSAKATFVETRDKDRDLGWSNAEAAAGTWLRRNAGPDDIVATNLILGALVPSLSRRTTFISDIHMQAPYGYIEDLPLIQQRESESWTFIDEPSADSLAPLCSAGVSWVWVDPARTPLQDWRPFAEISFSTPDAVILQIDRDQCHSAGSLS